jgi:hypothetical protein
MSITDESVRNVVTLPEFTILGVLKEPFRIFYICKLWIVKTRRCYVGKGAIRDVLFQVRE